MLPTADECTSRTPKRSSSPRLSISYSVHKRRRLSLASVDLPRELSNGVLSHFYQETVANRFVPSRPSYAVPLNSTPRTQRVANLWGLSDSRILKFSEPAESPPCSAPSKMRTLLLNSVSTLNVPSKQVSSTSALSHLDRQRTSLLVLDGSGMSSDIFSYPFAWSSKNVIAIVCGASIYSQKLDTRETSRVCKFTQRQLYGSPTCIEWGGPEAGNQDTLAVGTTAGVVELWDTAGAAPSRRRQWPDWSSPTCGMSWCRDALAVGRDDGSISLLDSRESQEVGRMNRGHKGKVHSVKWRPDGNYLASGDRSGLLFIWDTRACKALTDGDAFRRRQALAWCPWKSDLLASGSVYPEGAIRIWTTSNPSCSESSFIPKPLHPPLSLNSSVTSLHWSPHCKELLSTHGSSFLPSTSNLSVLKPILTPLTNSITVHSYPTLKRLVSVAAHPHPVGQSCLGPDGTTLFTVCNNEGTMKMWKIWGLREPVDDGESEFDRWKIR